MVLGFLGLSAAGGCLSNDLYTEGKVGTGIPKVMDRSAILAGKEVHGIKLTTSAHVEIRQGATASVVVKCDDNLEELISTKVVDDDLIISATGSYTTREGVAVLITLPRPDEVELAGSGDIEIKDVTLDSLELELTGSGTIKARGDVKELKVTLAGSGDVKTDQLVARKVTAEITGSGDILVQATQSLNATISGSGRLMYTGSPVDLKKSVTGSGSIEAK